MTAMISAMMAIVRVFIWGLRLGFGEDRDDIRLRPGDCLPFPAGGGVQSFGSYGSSTPRATRTTRRSG